MNIKNSNQSGLAITSPDLLLIAPGSTVILGLSGGPDSIFLLHALAPLHADKTITLIAAHLDHEWRTDSASDVEFCHRATQALGVTLLSAKLSELCVSLKFNGSKEELGRKARRYFFEQVADRYNAAHIALAHHADDQQETFFIRLIRGSSLAGLTGIKPIQGRYIRPLLALHKQEIVAYLNEQNIPYLTDPSNSSDDFLRNRIRHSVIPELQKCDSRFDTNFAITLTRLQETDQFLDELVHDMYANLGSTNTDGNASITHPTLLALHNILQHRLLILWLCKAQVPFQPSQALLDEIIRFLHNPGNKEHQIHTHWSIKKLGTTATIIPHVKTP